MIVSLSTMTTLDCCTEEFIMNPNLTIYSYANEIECRPTAQSRRQAARIVEEANAVHTSTTPTQRDSVPKRLKSLLGRFLPGATLRNMQEPAQ